MGSIVKGQRGFTIVELLIVVVVIGVLAAIVIVAYNGITQSAQVAAWKSSVNQMVKLFGVYAYQNGSYPSVGGYTCLAGFDSDDECHYSSGNDFIEDPALTSALQTVGTIPSFPNDIHPGYNGLVLRYAAGETLNGQPARYTLTWKIQGENQDCEVPNSVRISGGVLTYESYHTSWTNTTQCFVVLKDPQNL